MTKNWGIIIQARTGSKRLPNKMLLPFYKENNLLETIVDSLIQAFDTSRIILATTQKTGDDEIEKIAKNHNVNCYRGSEENVLSRFLEAANAKAWTHIVRVCADNPFLFNSSLQKLVEEGLKSDADYLAFFFKDNTPSIKTHSGFFAEWVSVDALKKIENKTNLPLYLEHVTNYIYSTPELFNIHTLEIEEEELVRKIRLTIDNQKDFIIAQNLFQQLKKKSANITWGEVRKLLIENPAYFATMEENIKNNQK